MRPPNLFFILYTFVTLFGCRFPDLPPIDEDGSASDALTLDSTDAPAGPLGGETLAQITIPGAVTLGDILAPPGGGVILALNYGHSTALTIAGTTVPCTRCDAIVKLSADLASVDWYAYSEDSSSGSIAMSPSGDVYWHLHGEESGTLTVRGSVITSPLIVTVPSNAGAQSGGARIVVALTASGTVRWHHSLSRTDTTPTSGLDGVGGFGASDSAVFSNYYGARGTLSFTDMAGATTSRSISAMSQVIHELDPATGRTVQVVTRAHTVAGDQYPRIVGLPGVGGKRFVVQRESYSAAGQQVGHAVSIGALGNGAFVSNVNYAISVPSGPAYLAPSRFQGAVGGRAQVGSSISVGSSSYAAPSTNGDAMYFVLDAVSSTVRATVAFASTGTEVPIAIDDAGDGDAFCVGVYLSSNLSIGSFPMPSSTDAASPSLFMVRARVNTTMMTFDPVWAVGYAGKGTLMVSTAASDQVTHDAYVLGTLGAGATADLGLTPIVAPPTTAVLFLIKVQRGV